ncbi:MAG: phosphate ABC transporter permease PstA [Lachnospiraceae bacterium]|nr:phosphate ABC transporter permease PstA [Lachnospiraceae bacterium]
MNDNSMKRIRKAEGVNRFMTGLLYAVGGSFLVLLIVLAGYIIITGIKDLKPEYLSFTNKGIGNQFFNTIYLVFWSLLISVPIGVGAGVYMAEYAGDNKFTKALRVSMEALSSLPSIVVGLFGYLVFILTFGFQWNLLAGALAVSILSLPSITTTTEDAIRSLPKSYKQGSMALGATHWKAITTVLLPTALPRIITGVILAAGRGFGEAAALLYTSGQSTVLNWNNWNLTSITCPLNPMRPGETLALHIWVLRTEGALNANSTEIANVAAMILVLLTLGFSITARVLTWHINKKSTGEK